MAFSIFAESTSAEWQPAGQARYHINRPKVLDLGGRAFGWIVRFGTNVLISTSYDALEPRLRKRQKSESLEANTCNYCRKDMRHVPTIGHFRLRYTPPPATFAEAPDYVRRTAEPERIFYGPITLDI